MNSNAFYKNASHPRVRLIVEMRGQCEGLRAIGEKLKVSKESVRLYILKISDAHGKKIFSDAKKAYTTQEAAKILRESQNLVSSLCKSKQIPCTKKDGKYILTMYGISKARKVISEMKRCIVCRKKMTTRHNKTCSDKCRLEQDIRGRKILLSSQPNEKKLRGWHKILWPQLKEAQIPQRDNWLTWGDALRVSTLSRMQFVWLCN